MYLNRLLINYRARQLVMVVIGLRSIRVSCRLFQLTDVTYDAIQYIRCDTIRYDTIRELNVCGQPSLAHVTKKQEKKKLK